MRFQPGNNGGPGRPLGSRNKLGEAFLEAMHADFKDNGVAAIQKVRDEKPDQYLKVIASILPKEMNLRVGQFEDMTDDDLARELASIASQLARASTSTRDGDAGADQGQNSAGKPAKLH